MVIGGCSNYDEDECDSKSLYKSVKSGNCDKEGIGYLCFMTPGTDEVIGTIDCYWVPANPDGGYPKKGKCSELSTGGSTENFKDCYHQEDFT